MTTWVNFQEIRARVSLSDVILKFYDIQGLQRQGTRLIGPCPVHGGDSPRAFHADLEKNVWHCFSKCRGGGNQLDFVAKKEGISIRDAALKLQAYFLSGTAAVPQPPPAGQAAVPTPERRDTLPAAAAASPERNPELKVNLALRGDHPHLLSDRRLAPSTVEHFGVGYCSQGILRGLIAIPVHDENGLLVAYAGRRLKPQEIRELGKYKFPKGFRKELVLYNLHRAREQSARQGVVLVEGFFSVLALHEAGVPNAVAAMGCELSDHQAQLLYYAEREVIILFDGDEAGRAGAQAAQQKLHGRVKTRMVRLPDGAAPDELPAKALRWLVNGMQVLDLAEVAFATFPSKHSGA